MSDHVVDVLLIRAHDHGRDSDQMETTDVVNLIGSLLPLTTDGQVLVGWNKEELPSLNKVHEYCLPSWRWRGEDNIHPHNQDSVNYALMNKAPAKPNEFNWDPDQRLTEFVALSRIVHPSAADFEHCARLLQNDGGDWDIIPADNVAPAYTTNARTFLLSEEWQTTGKLVELWRDLGAFQNRANRRIAKAIWWREMTARQREMDVRWMFLITAIESLIKMWNRTGGFGSTESFLRGMLVLAKATGMNYSDAEAREAYSIRSSFSHGQGWPMDVVKRYCLRNGKPEYDDEDRYIEESTDLYNDTEAILDAALRNAIQGGTLLDAFRDDNVLWNQLTNV